MKEYVRRFSEETKEEFNVREFTSGQTLLGQKGMSIKARKIRNFLTIAFENTNGEELIIENEEIVTTKKDKQNHGFGLNNNLRM